MPHRAGRASWASSARMRGPVQVVWSSPQEPCLLLVCQSSRMQRRRQMPSCCRCRHGTLRSLLWGQLLRESRACCATPVSGRSSTVQRLRTSTAGGTAMRPTLLLVGLPAKQQLPGSQQRTRQPNPGPVLPPALPRQRQHVRPLPGRPLLPCQQLRRQHPYKRRRQQLQPTLPARCTGLAPCPWPNSQIRAQALGMALLVPTLAEQWLPRRLLRAARWPSFPRVCSKPCCLLSAGWGRRQSWPA